ncbi:hypothetical protein [Nostoc sp. CHAB 5715]|uniref:hypothetical protein n=1 Tax=Nostoc sp. CHAB 5715 TaxID=2780400 RepID=UPI001E57F79B|nr:hypothetical protein [Nostoc sp. CHAB 5715]MCC5622902.1 hypothetical protein [Nostoc sp. CHAB 5715]
MNLPSPSSTEIYRLSRRDFIQYGSIWIGSSFIADCTNSNQPSTSNSWLDKVTFGTNWIAQAEHGGFYQAMSTTGCAYAIGIYKDYGLDVTIKMGGPQVPSGTQLLMGDAVDFFMGYGIDAVNAIAQGIGAMSDARWKSLFDSMVDTKISKSNVNYKEAYTLQFVNKGVSYYKK